MFHCIELCNTTLPYLLNALALETGYKDANYAKAMSSVQFSGQLYVYVCLIFQLSVFQLIRMNGLRELMHCQITQGIPRSKRIICVHQILNLKRCIKGESSQLDLLPIFKEIATSSEKQSLTDPRPTKKANFEVRNQLQKEYQGKLDKIVGLLHLRRSLKHVIQHSVSKENAEN